MDLQQAWNKLDKEKLSKTVHGAVTVQRKSHHPVMKLVFSFKIGLGFILIFEIGFFYLLFLMPQLIVKLGMGLMIVTYFVAFIYNYRTLIQIQTLLSFDLNVMSTMKNIYELTTSSLAFQRKAALYIYPLAAMSGFILGLSTEKDAMEMVQKPAILITGIIAAAILTPLSYYLALWMEKISYGKYLSQLKGLIDEMERTEP